MGWASVAGERIPVCSPAGRGAWFPVPLAVMARVTWGLGIWLPVAPRLESSCVCSGHRGVWGLRRLGSTGWLWDCAARPLSVKMAASRGILRCLF